MNITRTQSATVAAVGAIFFRDWVTARHWLNSGAVLNLQMSGNQTIAHAVAVLLESEQTPTQEHVVFAALIRACPDFDPHLTNDLGQTPEALAICHGNFVVAELFAPQGRTPAPVCP